MFTEDSTTISISRTAQKIPVDRIDSPYRINILQDRSTLKGGVHIQLETQIPCQLRAFWFVNIKRFYAEIDSPEFRLALFEDRVLQNHFIHENTFDFDVSDNHTRIIRFADAENHVQNTSTEARQDYPLVLILHPSINEDSQQFFQLPIQILALHVKSSIPTDPPTNIIRRISKLSTGQSLVLEDIYVPGSSTSMDICAVCLTEPVTHVLMPCKHAGACEQCFHLIDKCPICQKRVISYFKI